MASDRSVVASAAPEGVTAEGVLGSVRTPVDPSVGAPGVDGFDVLSVALERDRRMLENAASFGGVAKLSTILPKPRRLIGRSVNGI
jgi:hypothetical protein